MNTLATLARYWDGFVKRRLQPTQQRQYSVLRRLNMLTPDIKHRYLIHRREASPSPWLFPVRSREGTSTVHWTGELLSRPCTIDDWDGSTPLKVDGHEEVQGIQKVDMNRWSYRSISLIVRSYTSWKTLSVPSYRLMHSTIVSVATCTWKWFVKYESSDSLVSLLSDRSWTGLLVRKNATAPSYLSLNLTDIWISLTSTWQSRAKYYDGSCTYKISASTYSMSPVRKNINSYQRLFVYHVPPPPTMSDNSIVALRPVMDLTNDFYDRFVTSLHILYYCTYYYV